MTLALACAGLALVVLMTLYFINRPPEYRVWNASVIGALALFTAARLGFWHGIIFTAVAIALKDLCLYLSTPWWEPYPLSWLYFSGYALVGWVLLRRSASVGRAVATGFGAGALFFLASNFVSWLEQAQPYGYSLAGLVDCYYSAIPFYRGTFLGDVAFTAALFGTHALLSHAYFRQERVGVVVEEARDSEGDW
jgi:hypothetical protein